MNRKMKLINITAAIVLLGHSGCSTTKDVLAIRSSDADARPIQNPFGDFYENEKNDPNQSMILRTKKGDRSVEIELPRSDQNMTDFVIPVSPSFKDSGRSIASSGGGGNTDNTNAMQFDSASASGQTDDFKARPPTPTDREIERTFPQSKPEDEDKRHDIETGLGLVPAQDQTPQQDMSYLASSDHIKQLYKFGRFEAAVLATDDLIRSYPTDPKLYEMRGTLLDRLGKPDLALKSWNQALRFEPTNAALRKFVERRAQRRSIASP